MKISNLILTTSVFIISSSANAHLVSRLDGQAYYDDEANLSWLADANAGKGSGYAVGGNGGMRWENANTWAANITVGGVSGWRLPDTVDIGNDGATYTNVYQGVDYGYNITAPSEMSNMFYNVLGNTPYSDTSGSATGCTRPNWCLTNTGPFSNIQPYLYWSATEFAPNTNQAWFFNMGAGNQGSNDKGGPNVYSAWAVHSGDVGVGDGSGMVVVGAVPIPAAVWLFGSGLIGLIGLARR